jgi:hypothetical protein
LIIDFFFFKMNLPFLKKIVGVVVVVIYHRALERSNRS